ncbi:MAG: HAD-IIA family hydrolase [Methylococcales bacterium]
MEPFTNIGALIIDMDGVLWHGDQPLPGLADFFKALRDCKLPFILATNNASMTPDQYVAKLDRMGVPVTLDEILTSGMATAHYLAKHPDIDPASTSVFVIGEIGTRQPLVDRGFTLTNEHRQDDIRQHIENSRPDIVVCGLDREVSWNKLATATLDIRNGAKFIGTNADTTLPTERGVSPGNGAILAALKAATGITPTIIGKPEPIIYQQALALLGVDPAETVAIGDRLDTDILGAVRTNIRSILVLTGISAEKDLESVDFKPTWIMPDIQSVIPAILN